MDDFSSLAGGSTWLAVVLFLLFGAPALFSKTVAKVPGIIGYGARRWQAKKKTAAEAELENAELRKKINDAIDEAVDRRAGQFIREGKEMRKELDLFADFISYDAHWHRRLNITAGEQGCEVPPHFTLSEFKEQREIGQSDDRQRQS